MKKIFLTLALITGMIASAQVRIGGTGTAVDANAILELQSSTKGLLFPKVALTGTANVAPLAAHTAGMTVYNTATAGDVTPGLYVNDGAAWVKLGGSSSASITARTSQVLSSTYDWTNSGAGLVKFYEFTSGVGPINLPDPATYSGQTIYVRNNTGATVGFGTTNGVNSPKGVTTLVATGALQVWSDGTNWHNIAGRA
jgi:hypothetical protein